MSATIVVISFTFKCEKEVSYKAPDQFDVDVDLVNNKEAVLEEFEGLVEVDYDDYIPFEITDFEYEVL